MPQYFGSVFENFPKFLYCELKIITVFGLNKLQLFLEMSLREIGCV